MSKVNWLGRQSAPALPYLALVLSEKEFISAVEYINIPAVTAGGWLSKAADARVLTLETAEKTCCIVCLDPIGKNDPIEIAALLVHEAVHVWQQHISSIGETNPGSEQEAYAIQFISSELMKEYARRIKAGTVPGKNPVR